jgi:tRNA nucleotidyltransferase (CCA-adding enzyme)
MKKGIIEGNRESSFAQFRKGEKKFLRKLEDNGFKTIRTKMFQVDKHNVLIYEVEQAIIPKIYINKGPSFLMDDACREFAEKNVLSNIFIKEDRLCAERRREVNSIFDMKEKGRLIEPKCTEEESKLLDERVRQELTYILEGGI